MTYHVLVLRLITEYDGRMPIFRRKNTAVFFRVYGRVSLPNVGKYLPHLLTYLLTPCSRVLLVKLTGSAASQEIPRIFGIPTFITVLTSARHLSISRANYIQSTQPPPTSWRSILILSSHLRLGLPNGLFLSGLLTLLTYFLFYLLTLLTYLLT